MKAIRAFIKEFGFELLLIFVLIGTAYTVAGYYKREDAAKFIIEGKLDLLPIIKEAAKSVLSDQMTGFFTNEGPKAEGPEIRIK